MKRAAILLLIIAAVGMAATIGFTSRFPSKKTAEAVQFKKMTTALLCTAVYLPSADEAIPRLTGWGNYSWKITTESDSAQFYYDQGINMYYAFHIIESRASFDKATRFDPGCAMAWWGKALAFGPNINDFGYEAPSEAYPSAKKAYELKQSCTPVEKALIDAMSVRYSNDTSLDQNRLNLVYKEAMSKVYSNYRANADVSALFADALMLLHPWDLYNHDFSPKPWTTEITRVIENTLRVSPKHPGANHYYVHSMEASATPGKALRSAEILCAAMPAVSHITHMPSHIFIRTGYYNRGIEQNNRAVMGYGKYLNYFKPVGEGLALYSLHNTHMKLNCAQMAGNYAQAIEASKQLQQDVPAFYLSTKGAMGNYAQYLHQSVLFTLVRFGKWDEILQVQLVDTLPYTSLLQRFARGTALAKTNRVMEAVKELDMLRTVMKDTSLKDPLVPFNSAYDAALVAENILAGVIAQQQKDFDRAIDLFQSAVGLEDSLIYNEPRDWMLPARHYLGNALLEAKRYNEAISVFNADLTINPNNGWDLTGVEKALEKMNKTALLTGVRQRLKQAWLIKDVEIKSPVF